MSVSNRTILQSMLAADYDGMVRRLARRFGNADFASEALHETFARLENVSDVVALRNPKDYLFRTAINIGKNMRRAERVRASAADIDAVLDIADDAPTPAQTAESRSEMTRLMDALSQLPTRTRRVFEAVLFHNTPYAVIASQHGVSLRTVERDVQRAIEHCSRSLGDLPAFGAFSSPKSQ